MALLDHASSLAGLGERGACPRDETARELQVRYIYSGSTGAGLSGAMCLEEPGMRPEGCDPEDGDEVMELDLNDEPRVLLDFLNARRRKVAKSLFWTPLGLPRRIELVVLDFLTL